MHKLATNIGSALHFDMPRDKEVVIQCCDKWIREYLEEKAKLFPIILDPKQVRETLGLSEEQKEEPFKFRPGQIIQPPVPPKPEKGGEWCEHMIYKKERWACQYPQMEYPWLMPEETNWCPICAAPRPKKLTLEEKFKERGCPNGWAAILTEVAEAHFKELR